MEKNTFDFDFIIFAKLSSSFSLQFDSAELVLLSLYLGFHLIHLLISATRESFQRLLYCHKVVFGLFPRWADEKVGKVKDRNV
jgi:hypothetical protein